MSSTHERRSATRFPLDLEVDLHALGDVVRVRALDVSRHGLFVACPSPPPVNQTVLVTVGLRSGAFDTLATVVRRVDEQRHGALGAGLKLYCLGASAKERWDRFVAALESPGLSLPTRPVPQVAACFLVQPNDPAALLSFYAQHVLSQRTLYVTPAVRLLGAEVSFVLVHPRTHEECVQRATVVDWSPDQPNRMGVRFAAVDAAARRAFLHFAGEPPGVAPLAVDSLVSGARPAHEYAFFAPPKGDDHDVVLLTLQDEVIDKEDLFDFAWTNAGDPGATD